MTDLAFTVPTRSTEAITFKLQNPDGSIEEYKFTPQKRADMLIPYFNGMDALGASYFWLQKGLTDEGRANLAKRLSDPEDPLDMDTIGKVCDALATRVAGDRPTT